jgi:Predicted RNA-binding protein containing KH domain, possibly ribosomal protein
MTGKQRAYLRAQANGLDTILYVGKGGITEAVIRQTEEALAARELIKGRVLEASLLTAREACEQLAEATGAEGIQTVGSRFVLYRPDPKEPKYVLPKA